MKLAGPRLGTLALFTVLAVVGCRSKREEVTPIRELDSSTPAERPPVLIWMGAREDEDGEREGTPTLFTAPGGEELFLGRVDEPGRDGQVRVGAFHSGNALPVWLSSRLDLLTEKPHGIMMMLEAGLLVVTSADRRVLLLDPANGKVRATQYLETNALRICRIQPGSLRIDEADGSVDIDVASLTSRHSKSSCKDASREAAAKAAPTSKATEDGPLPRGYERLRALDVDGVRLALGRLGTETKLMRIDPTPGSRDTLWVVTVRPDELNQFDWHPVFWSDGNDIVVEAEHAVPASERGEVRGTGDYFLTGYDANTGRELWRASPGKEAGPAIGFVVSPTHIYIARVTQLDVFDRRGTFIGWVGWR